MWACTGYSVCLSVTVTGRRCSKDGWREMLSPRTRMENKRAVCVFRSLSEDSKQNEGLEIVMTHNCLLDAIRKGDLICLGGGGPVGGGATDCFESLS